MHTWAHLTLFGANVLEVAVFPRDHIARLGGLLDREALTWTPVLMDEDGRPGALLVFSPVDYSDEELGGLVDRVSSHDGFGALGHVPFHDHDVGHAHLFGPVGSPPAEPDGAPVFIHGTVHPVEDPVEGPAGDPATPGVLGERIEVWMFGTDGPLRTLAQLLVASRIGDVSPVESPGGWTAVSFSLSGPAAAALYARLEAEFTAEGLDVWVRPLQRLGRS